MPEIFEGYYPGSLDFDYTMEEGTYYGTHDFDYSMEQGKYYGTFSFENDAIGAIPTFFNVSQDINTLGRVISSENGHEKVIGMWDNNNSGWIQLDQVFSENQSLGTLEWWWRSDDTSKQSFFFGGNQSDHAWGVAAWQSLLFIHAENGVSEMASRDPTDAMLVGHRW